MTEAATRKRLPEAELKAGSGSDLKASMAMRRAETRLIERVIKPAIAAGPEPKAGTIQLVVFRLFQSLRLAFEPLMDQLGADQRFLWESQARFAPTWPWTDLPSHAFFPSSPLPSFARLSCRSWPSWSSLQAFGPQWWFSYSFASLRRAWRLIRLFKFSSRPKCFWAFRRASLSAHQWCHPIDLAGASCTIGRCARWARRRCLARCHPGLCETTWDHPKYV